MVTKELLTLFTDKFDRLEDWAFLLTFTFILFVGDLLLTNRKYFKLLNWTRRRILKSKKPSKEFLEVFLKKINKELRKIVFYLKFS